MTHQTLPNHVPWIGGTTCGDCKYCHPSPYQGGWWCKGPVPAAWRLADTRGDFYTHVDPESKQAGQCQCFVFNESTT